MQIPELIFHIRLACYCAITQKERMLKRKGTCLDFYSSYDDFNPWNAKGAWSAKYDAALAVDIFVSDDFLSFFFSQRMLPMAAYQRRDSSAHLLGFAFLSVLVDR